jgi:hypothetical protein
VGALDWLPYIALGATIVGCLDILAKLPPAVRLTIRAIAAEAALYLTLRRLLPQWSPLEAAAWMGGLGAGLIAFWTAIDMSAPKLKGERLPFLMAVLAGSTATVAILTGSALIGGLGGAVAAAAGTAFVLGWSSPQLIQGLSPSGLAPFALLTGLAMVHANLLSYTPALPVLLLAASPLLALSGRFWPPLIPIAGAVFLAGREHFQSAAAGYGF